MQSVEQSGIPPRVNEKYVFIHTKHSIRRIIDQTGRRFAGINTVQQDALQLCKQAGRILPLFRSDCIARPDKPVVNDNFGIVKWNLDHFGSGQCQLADSFTLDICLLGSRHPDDGRIVITDALAQQQPHLRRS